MRLSAETNHLLQKRLKEALRPFDIFFAALAACGIYGVAHGCNGLGIRQSQKGLCTVGLILATVCCLLVTLIAIFRLRHRKSARSWVSASLLLWLSFACGAWYGNQYWYNHLVKYYTWHDMASYLNIDPETDKGQSYMDAGTVYFKDGSHVLRSHGVSFHNGEMYCVAPIVMGNEAGSFTTPRSGTVDFWAVGKNCCGISGADFSCGDSLSGMAHSGLRSLDERSRSMYLLGVQEWSATNGIPVKHPLFFEWVKDPVSYIDELQVNGSIDFVYGTAMSFFLSLVASALSHNLFQKMGLY